MSFEATVIEVIKWIRESVRPVVVILVMSALALFLPPPWLRSIGIGDWLQRYRPWVILLFAGSLVWLGTFLIERLYKNLRMRSRLQNLADDEKHILRHYVQGAKTIQAFGWSNVGVARSLAMQGLLIDVNSPDVRGNPHFRIDLWVFSYLRKRPQLLDIPPQISS